MIIPIVIFTVNFNSIWQVLLMVVMYIDISLSKWLDPLYEKNTKAWYSDWSFVRIVRFFNKDTITKRNWVNFNLTHHITQFWGENGLFQFRIQTCVFIIRYVSFLLVFMIWSTTSQVVSYLISISQKPKVRCWICWSCAKHKQQKNWHSVLSTCQYLCQAIWIYPVWPKLKKTMRQAKTVWIQKL